ncbi:MAG TPA: AraC family transcriptional regulator [Novosphingobium sp.]|nr:AraC family transcriptional regulator [Novosphingobium sp.]
MPPISRAAYPCFPFDPTLGVPNTRRASGDMGSKPVAGDRSESGLRYMSLSEGGTDASDALSVTRLQLDREAEVRIRVGGIEADAAQLHLRDTPATAFLTGDLSTVVPPRACMDCSFLDLRPEGVWQFWHPADVVSFIVPEARLKRWAHEAGVRRIERLGPAAHVNGPDEVISGFGVMLLPSLASPATSSQLLIDQVLEAVCNYLIKKFSGAEARGMRGGLAAWQERRAKELIDSAIGRQVTLQELADTCRLSASHFAKAFRQTTGKTPHQWLIERRIDRAMTLMGSGSLTLVEIAENCGFADQSHFTRAFSRATGMAPGAWRRWVGARHDLEDA